MSYEAVVSPLAAKKIRAIGNQGVAAEIVDQIERLALDPVHLGVRHAQGIHAGRMSYSFRVSRLPWTAVITVIYVYHANEQTLEVIDLGRTDVRGRFVEFRSPWGSGH